MPYTNYTSQEVESRGEAIYVQQIREKVDPQHKGKFLVIDIETGNTKSMPTIWSLRNSYLPNIPMQSFTVCESGIQPPIALVSSRP